MSKFVTIASVAASLMLTTSAGVASAQQQTPSADTLRPNGQYFAQEFNNRQLYASTEKAADAYIESAKIARCLATTGSIDGLVGSRRPSDEDFAALTGTLNGDRRDCLRNTRGGLPLMVSASLAEEGLKAMDVEWEDRAMSLDMDEAEAFYLIAEEKASLDTIGRCLAVFSPGLAYKALNTEPGSTDEEGSFNTVYRSTPECGLATAPTGVPIPFQRAALAHGLYQWMNRDD